MFARNTKLQTISAFVVLRTIVLVTTQPLTARVTNDNPSTSNVTVTTPIQDYILKNLHRYNATLQNYQNQIDSISQSLENQLVGFQRLKTIVLNTIEDANKDLIALQLISFESKYCVQKYNSQLPYGPIIKEGIEICIADATAQVDNIVQPAELVYNLQNNYYFYDLRKALSECETKFSDFSSNYTICVKRVITNANKLTITNRRAFTNGIAKARCSLDAQIQTAAFCTSTFYTDALQSIGAVMRLVNDCIEGFAESASQNNTITASCPYVIDLKLKDSDFQNSTITNPFKGLDKSQKCVKIRYV